MVNSLLNILLIIHYYPFLLHAKAIDINGGLRSRLVHGLYQTTEFMDVMLVLFGFYMITAESDCRERAPEVFLFCKFLVTCRIVAWLVPLIFLIMFALLFGAYFWGSIGTTAVAAPMTEASPTSEV